MREPWVAYLVVLSVVALILLGKKMMFFSDEKDNKPNNKEGLKDD